MKICGLQKTTLLDYPGHVAATLFTGGCNFRCPFCHNSELLGNDAPASYSENEIFDFLKHRKGMLEGVVITGGEPTLQPDLKDFIAKIRQMGYLIKLDTNGYRPDILKELCSEGFIDYVAMDIKTCRDWYPVVAGIPSLQIDRIDESIRFLKDCGIPYEFRTTVVSELHTAEDFKKIGPWIAGCPNYYLQNFTDSGNVLEDGFSACSKEQLLEFADIVRPFVGSVSLRGIDY